MASSPDWVSLPEELLALIAIKLTLISDYIRFGAVCSLWNSVATNNRHRLPGQLPWLVTPTTPFSIPSAAQSKRVCGTGDGGWVITVESNCVVSLFNHFTGLEKPLPPLTALQSSDKMKYLWKAVLSSPPASSSDPDFIVMALYGPQKCLAFYKPENNTWVALDINQTQDTADLICHKGHFYAVDYSGRVVVCDLNSRRSPRTIEFAPAPERKDYHSSKRYLVESVHGELLQVVGCNRLYDSHGEVGMEVFRHKGAERSEEKGWDRVEDLGEQILLLGYYASLALSASQFTAFTAFTGCKGNWIYNGDFCAESSVSTPEPRPGGGTISLAGVHISGESEAALWCGVCRQMEILHLSFTCWFEFEFPAPFSGGIVISNGLIFMSLVEAD
ncbi:F-box protein At2g26160-like [Aristolochia californica]|uniref:F-box protein At2g26160-like n=1 Tax=Aristolochia californica TaxID=171875 RepID=UPI0035DA47AD